MYPSTSRLYSVVFMLLCLALALNAQGTDYRVDPAGQFGGEASTALVEGDTVYLGQGVALAIIDVSTSTFTRLGSLALEAEILAMHKTGSFLYCLLNDEAGLQVVDVSDPAAPRVLGHLALETNRVAGLDLDGDHLYVAAERGGFQIVDVSDPSAPVLAATVDGFYPSDIDLIDGYAITLTRTSSPAKLRVFDLSDPVNPLFRAQVDAPKGQSLSLSGDRALVACAEYSGGSNGLRLFDISDPVTPTETGYLPVHSKTFTATASGNHACLAGQDSVFIADIADPAAPSIIGRYDVPGPTHAEHRGAYGDGNSFFIYSRYSDRPMQILEVSDPTQPRPDRSFMSPHNVRSLHVHDDHLYVASIQYLFAYDLTDRQHPALAAYDDTYAGLSNLKRHSNHLTATLARPSTLFFLDVEDPLNIETAAQVRIETGVIQDYCFADSYAFVQTDMRELVTVDLSDPGNLHSVSTVRLAGRPRAVVANDDRLWSAFGLPGLENGVEIFDIADPTAPVSHSTMAFESTPTCLVLDSDTLYVGSILSDTEFKLSAYTVSDPLEPQLLAEGTGTGKIWDLEVRDGALLAAVEGGSVIRFVLNAMMHTLEQVDDCHSPGSLEITTTPVDENGVGTLYTSEGVTWETFGPSLQKSAGGGSAGYGTYGVAIQTFNVKKQPGLTPTLTLEQASSIDPPVECVCDTCEYTILPFALSADEVDDWKVISIGFDGSGTGIENVDVNQVYLYHQQQRLSHTAYINDDGFIILPVNKVIPKGESLQLSLVYRFIPQENWADIPDPVRTFTAQTQMEWVNADPVHSPSGNKIQVTPITGTLSLGRVLNVDTQQWYQDIQSAIDAELTRDGHTLELCPTVFAENVIVRKSLHVLPITTRHTASPQIIPSDPTEPTVYVSADSVTLDRLQITGEHSETSTVYIAPPAHGLLITGCRIQGGGTGIEVNNGANGGKLVNNTISEASQDGILVRGYAVELETFDIGSEDTGNVIHHNGRCGVHIRGATADKVFLGNNRIEHNSVGVSFVEAGGDNEPLWVRTWSPNTISNNDIGIHIEDSRNVRIYNQNITENRQYGIQVNENTDRVTIGGVDERVSNEAVPNTISRNQGPGIVLYGSRHSVSHDTLTDNAGAGIIVAGDQITVQSCTIERTVRNETAAGEGSGIRITDGSQNRLRDNAIRENKSGIVIEGGANNTLTGNRVEQNATAGIKLVRSSFNTLVSNTVRANNAGLAVLKGSENVISACLLKDNRTEGLGLYDSHQNQISANRIQSNELTGLLLNRANRNTVNNNTIRRNGVGIAEYHGVQNVFQTNTIEKNTKSLQGCGYHAIASRSGFIGNTVTRDQGDAIYLEQGSLPVMRKNNIQDNAGSGLTNTDPAIRVPVDNNWWGDASGPGGTGSGSGQTIVGNVAVETWALEPFDLVISAGSDTLYWPLGVDESLVLSVQHWSEPHDEVAVSVTDSLGWLGGPTDVTLMLNDSLGADTSLVVQSSPAPAGTRNRVVARATSTTVPGQVDSSIVYLKLYDAVIDTIVLEPDSVQLAPGDSLFFMATAYDRYGSPLPARFQWQAGGGSIDSTGLFEAGTTEGWYEIVATDSGGVHQGHAWIRIATTTAVQPHPESQSVPGTFALYQNHPNPFNPQTMIRYQLPRRGRVSLRVYDILGQELATLVNEEMAPGLHSITWDGRADDGSTVAAGLYFCVMRAEESVNVRKLILMK